MLPLTWIVSNWPRRKKGVRIGKQEIIHLIKLVLLTTVSVFIAYAMYNILRLGENFHLIASRNKDYIYPISHLWQNPFDPFISHIKSVYDWFWKLGPGLIVVFVIFSIFSKFNFRNIRKNRPKPETALIFLWSIIPIFISAMYAKTLPARYVFFTIPTVYIFASLIFLRLNDRKELIGKVLVFGLGIYVLLALRIDYLLLTQPEKVTLPHIVRSGFLEEWTSGTGIKEVSDLIIEQYRHESDKKIVVGTEGYFGTLPDGLQMYLNNYSEITVIGVGIDIKEMPTSLIESKQAGNNTYLVINNSRLVADPEDLNVELSAAYPKAFRQEGSREYNTLGPREVLYLLELKE
jgi:4-amino-4-deoxy-L-arabinose transferase-like glycosyltransferase